MLISWVTFCHEVFGSRCPGINRLKSMECKETTPYKKQLVHLLLSVQAYKAVSRAPEIGPSRQQSLRLNRQAAGLSQLSLWLPRE